ncbi:MAG: ankyrin repeat domain-containing protein [Boseongicola sp.]|nr:ankyrin repeat domain-containing protein [Boseongicola sp.]
MTFIDGMDDPGNARDREERIERLEAQALSLGIELHAAATSGDAEQIAVLIEHGAKPDARAPDGSTPLHTAARHGQSAAVAALVEAGANPDLRNDDATTPMHLAASAGDAASIALFAGIGADTEATDARGRTAFDRLPGSSPDRVREMCRPTGDVTPLAAAELRDQDRPAPETPRDDPGNRNPNHERTTDMIGHDGKLDAGLRKGDHVRQPDGSWLRVNSVDMHGAWLEGNIVTAQHVSTDWYNENVRVEGQIGPDGTPWKPPGRERGEPPGPYQDQRSAGNDRSAAGPEKEITLGLELKEEKVRQRHREDQVLQLACMATERIAPDQREGWGDLRQRIGKLLDVVDKAGNVPEEAIEGQARRTARKRAESDVWVRAAREAGGGLLHQSRARFEGSAEFCRQDQMARNAAALTKGLEGLTQDDLRPNNLERIVAKAVVVTSGTKDAEVARALESGLRLGWVPATSRIRVEQTQIVDRLSRPMEPLEERDRTELTDRVYRMFPEDDIRAVARGEGTAVNAVRDPKARSRLVENFRALHAEPVNLPTPWRELQAEIGVSTGAARERLQPERDLVAERNVISASM